MRNVIFGTALGIAGLAGILTCAARADAADWSVPHSWRWPLYVRVDGTNGVQTGEPRVAVWTQTSELQLYGSTTNDRYLHPGADIRGDFGDPVLVPASGTVERAFNYTNYCLQTGNYCRLWFKTDDDRFLYYVSHIDLSPTPAAGQRAVSTEIREKIQNAVNGNGDRSVTAGQKMATLTMFSASVSGWHHLHIGIVDKQQSYSLEDTLRFFEQKPVGENGATLAIVDDEPPVISEVQVVNDNTSTSALSSGVCGQELFSKVDIAAQITDTFFTDGAFATFPGKGTLPPTTGIRTARYLVRSQATGNVVQQATWYDLAQTPLTCTTAAATDGRCLLPGQPIDDPTFFARMALGDSDGMGSPSAGFTILQTLFDTNRSVTDYQTGEIYWHILTNANATDGNWDATQQPNGKYQVSVEATDFAGNTAAKSLFVTVHNPAQPLAPAGRAFGDVYVRDNDNDLGAVPSNLGGQPFWISPDIILVPAGTTGIDINTPSQQNLVTANVPVNVYVRMHNDGCVPIDGVKTQIFWANPAAISNDWRSIAPAGSASGTFTGDTVNPNGVSVPAGGAAILGPFTLTPTTDEAQFGGHRCLLAAVSSADDTIAAASEFDAPNNNNVGQRNLQVSNCQYALPNPGTTPASLVLTLDTDAEVDQSNVAVRVIMNFDQAWLNAWSNVAGVTVSSSTDGTQLIVRLNVHHIALPVVTLPVGSTRTISFAIELPSGTGSRMVSVTPTLNGQAVQGASCTDSGAEVVH